MTVCPAKTRISLGIRPVWSESSLCAQWVAKDPSFLHADSEDSDQTGQMPRLIWVFTGRMCHFVGFVMRQLIYICMFFLINEHKLVELELTWMILKMNNNTYDNSITVKVKLAFQSFVNQFKKKHTHNSFICCDDNSANDDFYLGQVMWKCVLCHMRTTKVQISLRIRAVWSAPLLFTA